MNSQKTSDAAYLDGPRTLEDLPEEWADWIARVLIVLEIADDPDFFMPTTFGSIHFDKMTRPLDKVFKAAAALAHMGRTSSNFSERNCARRIEQQLRDLCLSLAGEWFSDWMRARSVFLVGLRELLQEHEGEYVLIVPGKKERDWGLSTFAPTPRELVDKAKEAGFEPGRFFIQKVVPGAEEVPFLDLNRPVGP